jgi:hypothetical protein
LGAGAKEGTELHPDAVVLCLQSIVNDTRTARTVADFPFSVLNIFVCFSLPELALYAFASRMESQQQSEPVGEVESFSERVDENGSDWG